MPRQVRFEEEGALYHPREQDPTMSITAVALRRAVQRLMSSDSLLTAMERRVGVRRVIRRTGTDRARLRRAWAEPILAGRSCENLADRLPYFLSKP